MYTTCPPVRLDPALARHIVSVQHIRLCHEQKAYTYTRGNQTFTAPGIHSSLRNKYYAHHKQKATKRRRLTQAKGSSAKQGIEVDSQLMASFVRPPTHRMAIALLKHFAAAGQTLHACQVPVWIPQLECITQCDVITQDTKGRLHLWEVKTGVPIGLYREQGNLRGLNVPNTKKNHWLLQVRYTQLGLEATGIHFASVQVIQIYDYWDKVKKEKTLKIKVYPLPKWAMELK